MNARIGEKPDCLDYESLMVRRTLDTVSNKQGEKLIAFVNDMKGCVVNGRITPEYDNFTSMTSYRGKAVVNYFIVRQNDICSIKEFKVVSCTELVALKGIEYLLSDTCHITVQVELSSVVREDLLGSNLGTKSIRRKEKFRRKFGMKYMTSDCAQWLLPDLINTLEHEVNTQNELNYCYDALVQFLFNEADVSMSDRGQKRKTTKFKPYWDDDLRIKWKNMKESERLYRVYCKRKVSKAVLECKRLTFKNCQYVFDKSLKPKKRMYCHGKLIDIETCNTSNPGEFWEHIKCLGPTKRKEIPMEIEKEGKTVTEVGEVLNKWRCEFELLHQFDNANFNQEFRKRKLNEESYCSQCFTSVGGDAELNCEISYAEVKRAVERCKNKKATGADCVTNELLKHECMIMLIHSLFVTCFEYGLIPDVWRHTIINLIPKNDGYVNDPLKYRGLTLQSCIYNILSSVLNERIAKYQESHNTISDCQNGFRKGRSCLHHIFALTCMIRNVCVAFWVNKPL